MVKLNVKIKEKLGRVIGGFFSTSEIKNIFADANIAIDETLYAKWRITLDAFNKISTEEAFFNIIEQFCHPLNFLGPEYRKNFVDKMNEILNYEDLDIVTTDRTAKVIDRNDESHLENIKKSVKTSTDHIVDAINFFKNEYNKAKIPGLTYEYSLGENAMSEQFEEYENPEDYDNRLKAIKRLKDAGLIIEYEIEDRTEAMGYYIWDYAICKINESKLTQQEAPPATDAGVQELTKKIIHEHTHRFENSIQEKGIDLNHKRAEDEVLVKNKKKISLPKFSSTPWDKVEIRFIGKDTVYIKADKKTVTADYEGLGFRNDKNGKPNTAWHFLFELAKNNGETSVIKSPIPDSIKQQKRALSDRLKTIFKNDTDPFYDPTDTRVYKIKINLIPPEEENTETDKYGAKEYMTGLMADGYED
jgi:hypothetical protein